MFTMHMLYIYILAFVQLSMLHGKAPIEIKSLLLVVVAAAAVVAVLYRQNGDTCGERNVTVRIQVNQLS